MLTLIAAMIVAPIQASAPDAAKEDNQIICTRRANSTVGTHMKSKRTCMRKSDWDYIEGQTQREMQYLRDRHLSPGGKSEERGGSPQ